MLLNWRTYPLHKSPSSETDSRLLTQEIHGLVQYRKVHGRVHKNQAKVPIMGQKNPIHSGLIVFRTQWKNTASCQMKLLYVRVSKDTPIMVSHLLCQNPPAAATCNTAKQRNVKQHKAWHLLSGMNKCFGSQPDWTDYLKWKHPIDIENKTDKCLSAADNCIKGGLVEMWCIPCGYLLVPWNSTSTTLRAQAT